MELRDTKNLLVNGSTLVGFALLLSTCKCTTRANADVGGMMMDYHLDHQRLEKHIEDIIHDWYVDHPDYNFSGWGRNDGPDRSGHSDGPGTTGPANRDP